MDELPLYNPGAKCPKCSGIVDTEHVHARDSRVYDATGYYLQEECLFRKCRRCKYAWPEALNPPTPA